MGMWKTWRAGRTLNNWKAGLETVFSRRRYAYLALALFFVFLFLYAVLTNVVVLNLLYFDSNMPAWRAVPPVSLNPNLQWWDALPTVLLAGLAALGFSIAAFQLREMSGLRAGGGAGMAGSFLGLFATACPICQPLWLFWLGLGGVSAFLADWSIYIFAASLALLAFSVHKGLQAVTAGCRRLESDKSSMKKWMPRHGQRLKTQATLRG
jgi:hypothetical protein